MKPMESVETTGSHNSHSHGPLSYNENGLMNSYALRVHGNSFIQLWKRQKDPRQLSLLTTIYVNSDNDIATILTTPQQTTQNTTVTHSTSGGVSTSLMSSIVPSGQSSGVASGSTSAGKQLLSLNNLSSGITTRSGKKVGSGKGYDNISPCMSAADQLGAFAQLLGGKY